jgi:hypothetical protein
MKRPAIFILILLFPIFLAAVSNSPDHALRSAEDHAILAPGSSRDFRFPLSSAVSGENASYDSQIIPTQELNYPTQLYKLDKTPQGWTLSIDRQGGLACAVLLSPSLYTSKGRTAYALRSRNSIGNIGDPRIRWGNKLLGPANNLHFLASSAYVTDPERGEVLRIQIPETAVYGYWDTGAREYACIEGAAVRIRFFSLPHAQAGASHYTYTIPLTQNPARTL